MHEHRNTTLNIPRIMIISLIAWGIATPTHEFGHLLAAWSLGFTATLETLGYNAGSVVVFGVMTPFETVAIATAGSTFLILTGAILIVLKIQTIGIVFVLRSWIDMIPIGTKDGGIIADSSGLTVAIGLLLIEVVIVGLILWFVFRSTKSNLFLWNFFTYNLVYIQLELLKSSYWDT
jgi:hypothetical protein